MANYAAAKVGVIALTKVLSKELASRRITVHAVAPGVVLTDMKRTAEAMQVFVALTRDYPELADPYNNLAVLYAADGQLQSALTALQTALRNDPAHRAARENLGDVYLALALQAWSAASAVAKGDDAELGRKLRLARCASQRYGTLQRQRRCGDSC